MSKEPDAGKPYTGTIVVITDVEVAGSVTYYQRELWAVKDGRLIERKELLPIEILK